MKGTLGDPLSFGARIGSTAVLPPQSMPPNGPPVFARDFPNTPPLNAVVDAFARGDYAHVRAEGARLAETSGDENVRRAARMLISRTEADPLAIWLLVLAGALLAVVSGYWIAHGKAPVGTSSTSETVPRGDREP